MLACFDLNYRVHKVKRSDKETVLKICVIYAMHCDCDDVLRLVSIGIGRQKIPFPTPPTVWPKRWVDCARLAWAEHELTGRPSQRCAVAFLTGSIEIWTNVQKKSVSGKCPLIQRSCLAFYPNRRPLTTGSNIGQRTYAITTITTSVSETFGQRQIVQLGFPRDQPLSFGACVFPRDTTQQDTLSTTARYTAAYELWVDGQLHARVLSALWMSCSIWNFIGHNEVTDGVLSHHSVLGQDGALTVRSAS